MSFIALRAYSLYLVHVEAIALAKKLPLPPEGQAGAAVVGAFLLAEILYRAVERPFNRRRDRWIPKATA
jgi:peptidoglycan/LPS O-acetylase OafA/YrhL